MDTEAPEAMEQLPGPQATEDPNEQRERRLRYAWHGPDGALTRLQASTLRCGPSTRPTRDHGRRAACQVGLQPLLEGRASQVARQGRLTGLPKITGT